MSLEVEQSKRGSIQVIFGPMFSGKTTELIRIVKRFSIAKKRCLMIKYSKDVRYSVDGVSTHDKSVVVNLKHLIPPQAGLDRKGVHHPGRAQRLCVGL